MDIIGEFVKQFFRELSPLTDWASNNWAVTTVALFAMIYWTSRSKRHRHRF